MKKELKEYYCFNDYIMECPELKGKAAFLKGKKRNKRKTNLFKKVKC